MSELNYMMNGDYLLPEMDLTEAERQPLGKYGILRQQYLEQNRPGLYTRLILSGRLMEHLQEIDRTAHSRLENLMSLLTKQAGVTEELKARDQMAWVGAMNNLKSQAEEMILTELIYAGATENRKRFRSALSFPPKKSRLKKSTGWIRNLR